MANTVALLLQPAALHAALLASDSATAVLEDMCGGRVSVRRLAPDTTDHDHARCAPLQAGPGDTVTLRCVQLVCGSRVLSDAQLRYLPSRLPADLARGLRLTDVPFGHLVRRLGLRRTTLAARVCAASEECALIHRAVLAQLDGRRVALVDERYPWSLFS